ncbi:MAG: 3-isopropylmalate dehydrogenase [Chloroflexota bacterium]
MKAMIAVLPGDGVGPEVMRAALLVLDAVARNGDHEFNYVEGLIGGIAIDETGSPLPTETVRICESADAVLLGAVGGPKWDDPKAPVRPEQGLLGIRKHFDLFANLRPVKVFPSLSVHAPLRAELLENVDLLFVRELTGGIYFGPREEQNSGDAAFDTMQYTSPEVERVAHVAFRTAQRRQNKVTSVDKANVLASMRLWRSTVSRVHEDYQDVLLEHALVDSCAMHLLTRPASFDVLLAGNMFGDILSDEASVLAGSLGMLPSASLGEGAFGLYEPVHGSAPDIAGKDIANPVGMVLSVAMLLRYSLNLEDDATAIEAAVEQVLNDGYRTRDLATAGTHVVGTLDFAQAIIDRL